MCSLQCQICVEKLNWEWAGAIRNAEIGKEKKEGAENLTVHIAASLDVILW